MKQISDISSALAGGVAEVTLAAAPWLLLGLVIAGVLRAWLPDRVVARWLGGRGAGAVFRAALVGTPLPLCSCGVLPAAIGLRRQGASKEATVSFLVATPENGADSIALTAALMGPFMTIARIVAALASAIVAGLATAVFARETNEDAAAPDTSLEVLDEQDRGCCNAASSPPPAGLAARLWEGLRYTFDTLLADLALWLVIGIVLAGVIAGLVPPDRLGTWGSGPLAMLLMAVIGVPLYVCATAWTPIGASLILAGMSPGTVLVLLLAGPATNLGTIGIVKRELGTAALIAYLTGVCGVAIAMGLATDALIGAMAIDVRAQTDAAAHLVPSWLAIGSTVVLGILLLRIALRSLPRAGSNAHACCASEKA
jgi:uncharacterized membrane protein YraQ (UPF0718 family)